MDKQLPSLRRGLDVFPSPVPERPGLVLRDPFRYSDEVLIIPPLLAACLSLYDGESTLLDVQAHLTRLAGQLVPSNVIESLTEVLQKNGYLETEEFERMQAKKHAEFAAAPVRLPAHAGSGYPDQTAELHAQLDQYLNDSPPLAANTGSDPIIGLAAPHVSPFGGWQSYAAAYGRLSGAGRVHAADKTVVLLGTSHYGQPERFGLTRKPFVTPLGTLQPDLELIDSLAKSANGSALMEDYCHSMEHSIEFQCVFLQQMLGSDFKILPVLCGPFAKALYYGEPPENDDQVLRFFDALGEMAELHRSKLFWVLGIDLAHIGRRYGDDITAHADEGEMLEVKDEDLARLQQVCDGNSEEFFEMVRPEEDRLKWCGFSPLYTFLNVVPEARGKLLRYDQWNIDEQSVVSFAAMEFV
ncbi:MAG: AmmeMemoRadiSam system protein B [Blastocatellia bacterium]